jgi:GT2 family glycosyltransferase
MQVSILLLTINRFNETREYVGDALANAGHPFDLCISDNGSTEANIFEWCEQQNPKVYFKNNYNYGTAQSLNRMIKANPSDYYVFIGNDIKLPNNWLHSLINMAESTKGKHGVIGIDWRNLQYPEIDINGVRVWETTNTFGTMCVSQELRDTIGDFCEEYGVYGLWDSDYSIRATASGRQNFYLPNLRSHHFGNDVGNNTEYRRMKDESLQKARPIFDVNHELYKQGKYYKKY